METEYPFRNLVFEGGGTLGTAYVGVMEELEKKGILQQIQRAGGASAGAINAVLFALNYSSQQVWDELKDLDYNSFLDYSLPFKLDCIFRIFSSYGLYRGDTFKEWIRDLIAKETKNADITFQQMVDKGYRSLYLIGTNLCTSYYDIYSVEHTPNMPVADAVRISMSIPLMFATIRSTTGDVNVDGGVLNNYPVRIFDQGKYIDLQRFPNHAYASPMYQALTKVMNVDPTRYLYNRETLGFRLDSDCSGAQPPDPSAIPHTPIDNFREFFMRLTKAFLNVQSNSHLETEDWHRTIYIDTHHVNGFDFNISMDTKNMLVDSGRKGVQDYFKWYDNGKAKEYPINKPDYAERNQIRRKTKTTASL